MDLGYIAFSNEPQRYLLISLEVTGSDWNLTGPFKVGDSVSIVRGILGVVAKDDSELSQPYGSEGGTVTFDQANGLISRISYECYTG